MKTGKEHWILIHIEVQGYVDKEFPLRMYMYNYRSFDKLGKSMTALAILTDDDENYHPKYYEYKLWDTKLRYDFQTYKLLEQKLEHFEDTSNIFAIVMKMAWYGLKNNRLKSDEDLLKLKISLIKELFKYKIDKVLIGKTLNFINYYIEFSKKDFEINLDNEIEIITEKNSTAMSITEVIQEELMKIQQKRIIMRMLNDGQPEVSVAKWFDVTMDFIEEAKREYKLKEEVKTLYQKGEDTFDIRDKLGIDMSLVYEAIREVNDNLN